jgi:hypothetical protein
VLILPVRALLLEMIGFLHRAYWQPGHAVTSIWVALRWLIPYIDYEVRRRCTEFSMMT